MRVRMAENTAARPVPIALVVCDNIYADRHQKRALIGLFNRITVTTDFPVTHRRMCVYVSITELYPNATIKLDIVHAETDEPVMEIASEPTPPGISPKDVLDMQFELENLQFKEEGLYYVRFFGNEEILLQRPLRVVRLREGKPDERDS